LFMSLVCQPLPKVHIAKMPVCPLKITDYEWRWLCKCEAFLSKSDIYYISSFQEVRG
jgi:hypothetical protein